MDETARVSSAIAISRVLCIFLVIYVHVNPGIADTDPQAYGIRAFDWARYTLVNSLGRVSVGLLSVVSGYLAVGALSRAGYGGLLAKRVRTLIIPMVLWSALFLLLALAGDRLRPGSAANLLGGPLSPGSLPDLLLGLTRSPANAPLNFLRDIFVCTLLAPLLLAALKRHWALMAGLTLVIYAVAWFTPLLLTPNLIPLFAIGLYLGQCRRVPAIPAWLAWACWGLVIGIGAWVAARELHMIAQPNAADAFAVEAGRTAIRLPAAMALWAAAHWLAGRADTHALVRLEPYIFTAFCSHVIVLTLVWFVWEKALGGYYAAAYPVFFLLGPAIAIVAAMVFARLASAIAPPAFALLNGGRNLTARA